MSPKEQHDNAVANRPDVLAGATYKVKIPTSSGDSLSFYVTVNDQDREPFEVFVNCKNAEYAEHMNALTVMVSRMLRAGIPVTDIAEDLQAIHSPFTGHMMRGGWCTSVYARIGKTLIEHKRQLDGPAGKVG